MLFRASGIDHIKNTATPINLSEQARKDSLRGFHQASLNLTKNLPGETLLFQKSDQGLLWKIQFEVKTRLPVGAFNGA
jgi:rhombotail lipoprotein